MVETSPSAVAEIDAIRDISPKIFSTKMDDLAWKDDRANEKEA